ncbi:MAG TPA: hypothetical protein VF398_09610 [bacterium]
MARCIKEELGHLITFYEMDALREDDRLRFENHILDCPFCRSEVSRMFPLYRALDQSKSQVLARLQASGISFDSIRRQILATIQRSEPIKTTGPSLWRRLILAVQGMRLPGEVIPALAATALILLLILLPTHPPQVNPYSAWLSFEKAYYQSVQDRAPGNAAAEAAFQKGMEFYQENNFKAAAGLLATAVQEDSLEGRYWLYLGISYYLDHQARRAVAALTKAESLSDPAQRNRARWYLAEAYLLQQDTVRSMPLLQSLVNEGYEYSEEADSLLIRVREMPK